MVGEAVNESLGAVDDNMPDPVIDFEDENGIDGAKALEYSRTLKLEYDPAEVEFWFMQLENEMMQCEIKSQWMKRCILVKNLPPKVQADVKSLLLVKQTAAPVDLYKKIKTEILRLHAPQKEATFKKALSRVLTGVPSQLGQVLINDICDRPVKLDGCCCAKAVYCLFSMQLPQNVRAHIADLEFNKNTYQQVFQTADKIFLSTRPAPELSASVAAVVNVPEDAKPEVAALKPKNGGGRWYRKNKNANNQSGSDKSGQKGSGSGNSSSNSNSRGPRHSSNPPSSCCDNHYRWGASSWFCLAPLSCPWKDKIGSRPSEKKENK